MTREIEKSTVRHYSLSKFLKFLMDQRDREEYSQTLFTLKVLEVFDGPIKEKKNPIYSINYSQIQNIANKSKLIYKIL